MVFTVFTTVAKGSKLADARTVPVKLESSVFRETNKDDDKTPLACLCFGTQ